MRVIQLIAYPLLVQLHPILRLEIVTVASGRFITQNDIEKIAKVVVLGYTTAQTLFGDADPVGEKIYVGDNKLTVVGVMDKKGVVGNTNYDERVYIPLTLVFEKYTFSPFARIQGTPGGNDPCPGGKSE